MRLQQEGARIEHQDPERGAAAKSIEFFGTIAAEHARPDHHHVKGVGARALRGRDLLPIVANIAADDIVTEVGLLHVVPRWDGTGNEFFKRHNLSSVLEDRQTRP